MRLFLPLLPLLFFLSACAQPQTTHSPDKPISKGQQIFLSYCVSCHQGTGETPGPNAVVLNSATLAQENTFRNLLRQPSSPMMRAFSAEELPETDVHELYQYLFSLQNHEGN
jgi:mono/diheme cytochrome c family protein